MVFKGVRASDKLTTMLLLVPFLAFFIPFFLIPLLGLVIKSFTTNNCLTLEILSPSILLSSKYTFDNYISFFIRPYYQECIVQTIFVSFMSALLVMVFGTPASYIITDPKFKFGEFFRRVLTIPALEPIIVLSYSMLLFLGPIGPLSFVLYDLLKITKEPIYLSGNIWGVIFATVYALLPIYIRTVSAVLERIEPSFKEASMALGATEAQTFFKIILPLAMPGILAGFLLTFATAFGLFSIPLLVGGGAARMRILSLEINLRVSDAFGRNVPLASAMAVVMVIIVVSLQELQFKLAKWVEGKIK